MTPGFLYKWWRTHSDSVVSVHIHCVSSLLRVEFKYFLRVHLLYLAAVTCRTHQAVKWQFLIAATSVLLAASFRHGFMEEEAVGDIWHLVCERQQKEKRESSEVKMLWQQERQVFCFLAGWITDGFQKWFCCWSHNGRVCDATAACSTLFWWIFIHWSMKLTWIHIGNPERAWWSGQDSLTFFSSTYTQNIPDTSSVGLSRVLVCGVYINNS